jgi:aryl-alcohol dehydrogenase-like predicted oxidoreductase
VIGRCEGQPDRWNGLLRLSTTCDRQDVDAVAVLHAALDQDVDRIDLYQLHAPDPRISLSTSVRALARLERDGLIAGVGLCNVTVGQIEDARGLGVLLVHRHRLMGLVKDPSPGSVPYQCR